MSGRKGFDFEDQVEDALSGYFTVEKNVELKGEVSGKRREFDIIATSNVPPFGNITFLIECKSYKIGNKEVDEFIDKIADARKGGDPRSIGKPIMVSPEGFTSGAEDMAKENGIILLTLEDLITAEIPLPPSVQKYLNAYYFLGLAVKNREEYLVEKGQEIYDIATDAKSQTMKKTFDVIMTLEHKKMLKKTTRFSYLVHAGRVNTETYGSIIKQLEKAIELDEKESGWLSGSDRILGFVVDKTTPEERKEFNKIRPRHLKVCLIDTQKDTEKIYGSREASPYFRLKSFYSEEL